MLDLVSVSLCHWHGLLELPAKLITDMPRQLVREAHVMNTSVCQ